MGRRLALAALLLLSASPAGAEGLRPVARPALPAAALCAVIEAAAEAEGLEAGFLARVLWRESRFDPSAVSPKGAQGIAQFMPATAARRGLSDPFEPVAAIAASAAYLADLAARFGNPGLAAAAYNAGEARAAGFVAGGGLPAETRAYVAAITGHAAEAWREAPPPAPDWRLDPARPFAEACLALAVQAPEPAPALMPWGVVLAAQGSRAAAEAMAARAVARHAGLLSGERVDLGRARVLGALRHVAQVGRGTRGEAEALCAAIRAEGGACVVLRNP